MVRGKDDEKRNEDEEEEGGYRVLNKLCAHMKHSALSCIPTPK